MKLPSLQTLWTSFLQAVKRFPFELISALIGTIAAYILVGMNYKSDPVQRELLTRVIMVCGLALTLLFSASMYAERHQLNNGKKWIIRLIIIGIVLFLFYTLQPYNRENDLIRFFFLAIAFHLLVAFAPFIGVKEINGFWQYNKSLFLRFLTAVLYSGVLYVGLAIALVSVDKLFNVRYNSDIYLQLWVVIAGLFNTTFFLQGVPISLKALNDDNSYPKGLKIFTQYVLIPLMTIYLLILLAYEGKIIIEWHLPKGLVSTLVLGYAVFGILSLLLIYPIREKEGNGWIKLFSRFFYIMLIPLIILLALAIGKRVSSYGITEGRYVILALALWLVGITLYFLFSKKHNIKLIPISLCIVLLLASYGPQSAFSVAKASQTTRLKELLGIKPQTKKTASEALEVVNYLVKQHGLTSIQQFTDKDLYNIDSKINAKYVSPKKKLYYSRYDLKNEKLDTAIAILKIDKKLANQYDSKTYTILNFNNKQAGMLNVKGFDQLITFERYADSTNYTINNDKIRLSRNKSTLNIDINQEHISVDILPLAKKLEQLSQTTVNQNVEDNYDNRAMEPANMTLIISSKQYEIKMVLNNLDISIEKGENNKLEITNFSGSLLLLKKVRQTP